MAKTKLFRTILCPVDFSDHSRQALAYAALLTSRLKVVARYGASLESLTIDVAVGRPYEEIAWTAEQLDCDLIVMGAHDRMGANPMLFGSTTHRILRKSPLPVRKAVALAPQHRAA
jgi:nucleotide-binding universal stress UspA family protein